MPVLCSGSLFYRITDSYKVLPPPQHYGKRNTNVSLQATFAVSDVERNVQNIGTSAMRSILGTFTYDKVCFVLCRVLKRTGHMFTLL